MEDNKALEHRREIVRNSQAKRRALLKERGLCIQCGKKPVFESKTLCEDCLKKQREATKKYLANKASK